MSFSVIAIVWGVGIFATIICLAFFRVCVSDGSFLGFAIQKGSTAPMDGSIPKFASCWWS